MIFNKKGYVNFYELTYPLSHELTGSIKPWAYLLLCLFLRNLFLRL